MCLDNCRVQQVYRGVRECLRGKGGRIAFYFLYLCLNSCHVLPLLNTRSTCCVDVDARGQFSCFGERTMNGWCTAPRALLFYRRKTRQNRRDIASGNVRPSHSDSLFSPSHNTFKHPHFSITASIHPVSDSLRISEASFNYADALVRSFVGVMVFPSQLPLLQPRYPNFSSRPPTFAVRSLSELP